MSNSAFNQTGTANASDTVIGATKLSVAPASAANPIAVGDNDPRVEGITVSLTAANIIAMYSSPIVIIAGQTGKIIKVESAVFSFTAGGTQFTSGGEARLYEETSGVTIARGMTASDINGTTNKVVGVALAYATNVYLTSGKGITVSNETGSFATGDGTLKIFIKYRVITL